MTRPVISFKIGIIATHIFWYLALFPGRLGFDYSEAVRMMRKGDSTDWWTAEFWWYLKATTVNGKILFLSSLISMIIYSLSVYFFVQSLPISNSIKRKSLLIYYCSPIFGGFCLNVSHDVFQTAGIILFIAIQLRDHYDLPIRFRQTIEVFAGLFVMTTAIGPLIIGTYLLVLILQRKYLRSISLVSTALILTLVSSLGVREAPKLGFALPIIGDIKCIVQHPDVSLSSDEWKTLEEIAEKDQWLEPKPCSLVDVQIESFDSLKVERAALTQPLIRLYIKLVSENPAIFVVAHLQRASQALPPPFFHGPQNQIDLNPELPLGIYTNTALQDGTELLHPSIDEASIDLNINLFKPLEIIAQIGILIVNQASWFWGWGGLWLWPILIFNLRVLRIRKVRDWIKIYMPVITLHGFLVIVLSAPQGRYVMSTITIGLILTIVMVLEVALNEKTEI